MNKSIMKIVIFFCTITSFFISTLVQAERIRDLTTVLGVRENALIGYGLVVGLDGTGDRTTQTPFTTQSLRNMLSQLGVTVPTGINMQIKNVAAVMVTATLPAFARAGQKIDVVVSSLGSAKSLRGGTLLMTPLKGVDNQIYALAQGNILVSGASAQTTGNKLQINQLNGGRISGGAIVERNVPIHFGDKNIILQLKKDDFSLAQQMSDAINHHFGQKSALPLDSRTISITIPNDGLGKVNFLSRLQNIPIVPGPTDAIVVINSRTGSVVINQDVMLGSCAVAHGQLVVEVNKKYKLDQPNTPFGGGRTVVIPDTSIGVRNEGGALHHIDTSANLNDVISALNRIGATPHDLMAILESMQSAGCLNAKLEVN